MSGLIVLPSELESSPREIPCHIDGVIPERSLVGIAAQSGAGKTFVALDMALSIAARREWLGRHHTRGAGVLYVFGEGFAGAAGRVLAWCTEHDVSPASIDQRIAFCRVPVDISDQQMLSRIHAELAAYGLEVDVIFIDTLSANAPPGFSENDTQHMKALMDAARSLRDSLPCTVVLAHHMGHNDSRERGSTDFRGALDVLLYLKVDGNTRTLSVNKSRDLVPLEPIQLVLRPCHGSAVIELQHCPQGARSLTVQPSHRALLVVLAEISQGVPVKAGEWNRLSGYSRSNFYKLRAELESAGFVAKARDGYVLTRAGEDVAKVSPNPAFTRASLQLSDRTPEKSNRTAESVRSVHPPIRGDSRTPAGRVEKQSDRSPIGVRSDSGPGLQAVPWDVFDADQR